jgi:hypothetical protein
MTSRSRSVLVPLETVLPVAISLIDHVIDPMALSAFFVATSFFAP